MLFVMLTMVLAALDVDYAFRTASIELTGAVGAVAVLAGWFAAYGWLAKLIGGRHAVA